jgi:hypothetical protein
LQNVLLIQDDPLEATKVRDVLVKERVQVTLNSIGDAVESTDVSGRVTFLNMVAEKPVRHARNYCGGVSRWATYRFNGAEPSLLVWS